LKRALVKSATLVFFEEFNGAPIAGSTLRFDKQGTETEEKRKEQRANGRD